MSVNKAIILGRLGQDPELRYTPSGRPVANFNVATDAVWKDRDGQQQKHTEWHRIVVWGPQAETCNRYLNKGREVFIEGEIRTRSYDDKEGIKRYVTEIIARDVRFVGGQGGRGGSRGDDVPAPTDDGGFGDPSPGDDDVPF
jgi:single-strand DNA-binding protein